MMRVCVLVLLFLCATPCASLPARAGTPAPVCPDALKAGATPVEILSSFLNLPYREDGAQDENGRWTLFADPSASFKSPGANCSGFVLSASRCLLGRNITLAEALRDRAGDSGAGSAMGRDWDFGWDLIRNISEGLPRALLLPGGGTADPNGYDGRFRGWELNSDATWQELLPRLKPGRLYLLSFSKETRAPGYTLLHYHVGILIKGPKGEALLFQTSSDGGKVNRRNLADAKGMASLHRDFADRPGSKKMLAVIEVALPERR